MNSRIKYNQKNGFFWTNENKTQEFQYFFGPVVAGLPAASGLLCPNIPIPVLLPACLIVIVIVVLARLININNGLLNNFRN